MDPDVCTSGQVDAYVGSVSVQSNEAKGCVLMLITE